MGTRTYRTVLEMKIKERRQTLEEFAEYAEVFARERREPGTLSVRHLQRLVAGRGTGRKPLGEVRPATARLLEAIFGVGVDELLAAPEVSPSRHVNNPHAVRQSTDLRDAFRWLDERAGWRDGTAERKVMSRLSTVDTSLLLDRRACRAKVGRSRLADAVGSYYHNGVPGYGLYRVRGAGHEAVTTILSKPGWLDLACPLAPSTDRFELMTLPDEVAARRNLNVEHAVDRLVEAAALNVRLADGPLYRLLDVDVRPGAVQGTLGLAPFVAYALTLDLLEAELADAITAAGSAGCGELPLRDKYLPNITTALDVGGRLCVGGVLALCAVARPADPYRGPADYALLVQERSEHVLNATSRLAVIPKGFHEPLKDVRADVPIGATLLREMEEELFGRVEVDSTLGGEARIAAPMHPSRLSDPMRWLTADADRLRMECTGFGINLVSGNYEFSSLVVTENDEFWTRFGGDIEANWESSGLRVYSSLDRELLNNVILDEAWSNEGLFAFVQGLRRLAETGGPRVNLPALEREV